MVYEAIIFDLDGTAIPSARHGTPTDYMCQTVRANRDKIKLCAATGRPWPLAKPIIDALGVNQPSIVSGGTIIVDPVKEQLLWQVTLPARTVHSLLEVARQYTYVVSYARGLEVGERLSPQDVTLPPNMSAFYILDIPDVVIARTIEDLLQSVGGITVSKAHSWNIDGGIDLHITSHEATKEHAVKQLCKMLDVDPTKVAGVGDGFNDIHLFNAVGHKVAMGNAVQELKAAADEVIENLDAEGLAKFITKAIS